MPRILAHCGVFGTRAKDLELDTFLRPRSREEAVKEWAFEPGVSDAAPQWIDDAVRADPEYTVGKYRLDRLADVSTWTYGQVIDGGYGPAPAWLAEVEGDPSSGYIVFLREHQVIWLRERVAAAAATGEK